MSGTAPILIIGSGLAGYTLARELRKLDSDIPLSIVTADDGAFYSKPMLSNALAQGKSPDALATSDAARMSATLRARILTHTRVASIDPARHWIDAGGERLDYARLVLATGATPIRLALRGDAAQQVLSVNDLSDYRRFRAALEGKRDVTILGPGLIGCEFANDLAGAGYRVHMVGPDEAPLGRLIPATAGYALQTALAGLGVCWHLGTTASAVEAAGRALEVRCADGQHWATEVVLSAVGLRPDLTLAQGAGLTVNRGVVVDRRLQTSAADVYALGDAAEVAGMVLPFVMPIMHAARALAKTLCGVPTEVTYPAMPVVVKTPAHPVVVAAPPPSVQGAWAVDGDVQGVRALFRDVQGVLRGFVLTGRAMAEKQALTSQLPPLLP